MSLGCFPGGSFDESNCDQLASQLVARLALDDGDLVVLPNHGRGAGLVN